jgi:hypothetical protein
VTEPEALMMLATSEKRWQPSYNADIAVTRDGIIVSQFLTKRPTDFHSFAPALAAVIAAAGHPINWIGDGHYGTHANLVLAHQEGVILYAPAINAPADEQPVVVSAVTELPPSCSDSRVAAAPVNDRFSRSAFHLAADRDALICPAGHDLSFVGVYGWPRPYRLYRKLDCTACAIKAQCTEASGRRVRFPLAAETAAALNEPTPEVSPNPAGTKQAEGQLLAGLVRARDLRMKERGDELRRMRGSTVEPVNAHLKQHGLGRFHVHGLARCAAVLTLACIGHNVMKWKARAGAKENVRPAA